MSRSYHVNRKKIEELKKESSSDDWSKYYKLRRLKGELNKKRFNKKKEIKLKRTKKLISNFDEEFIHNYKDQIFAKDKKKIKIYREEIEDVVYPVTNEDIMWLLKVFPESTVLKVHKIYFELINGGNNLRELFPGIESTGASGFFYPKDNSISITGIKITKKGIPFLKHALLYYKVIYLSILTHEIFHNVDYNSKNFRKGLSNRLKYSGIETFACANAQKFYLKNIVPYIKTRYEKEYKELLLWMKSEGVMPLTLEFWEPAVINPTYTYWYSPIESFFNEVSQNTSVIEKNLALASGVWYVDKNKALDYYDYILTNLDENHKKTLLKKARLYLWDNRNLVESLEIFEKILKQKDLSSEFDRFLMRDYATLLLKNNRPKEAYEIFQKYKKNIKYNYLEYAECLVRLNKVSELNLLIKEINEEAFEFYEEDKKQSERNLYIMMIYLIKKDYDKTLAIFKKLKLKNINPNDYLMSTSIATKIYMFLKDYKQAEKLLFHKNTFSFYEKAIKEGMPLSVMDDIDRLQDYFLKTKK